MKTAVRCLLTVLVVLCINGPGTAEASTETTHQTIRGEPVLEGALGLLVHHNPPYTGALGYRTRVTPAGFVRWGRLSLTGSGGFTTRRQDDVDSGLGAELVRLPTIQLKLGLRYDNGRSASDDPRLAALSDVPRTVRARLSARWAFLQDWRLTGGLSVDAAGRGAGYVGDLGVARTWPWGPDHSWTMAANLTAAGDRYLQNWYGVTPEQSVRSGLPVYTPGEGLRDASVSATWRAEFVTGWAAYAGLGLSRQLGAAARSPLTTHPAGVSMSAGLVRRF